MATLLMVNLPFAGHTNPTLPLAQALVAAGHRVDYVNAPEMGERIAATGANFIPYTGYPEQLDGQAHKRRCFAAVHSTLQTLAGPYDALLGEMLFFPAATIARRMGVPYVRQFSLPAWSRAALAEVRKSSPLLVPLARLLGRQMCPRATAAAMGAKGVHLVPETLRAVTDLDIVYLSRELQPAPGSFGPRTIFTGPLLRREAPQPPLLDYDALRRPLVYVSMGSIMSSRIFCKRIVRALGGCELEVVLSTGRIDPAQLSPLPANFHAARQVPQLQVLRHADLFLTHAGMNSVNEAVYHGVPMLVMPVMNDQPANAAMACAAGIAHHARAFPTSARAVRRAVLAALSDCALRQRAAQFGAQVRNTAAIAPAVQAIEALL